MKFTKTDVEIWRGIQELLGFGSPTSAGASLTTSDIESAYGIQVGIRKPSQRTIELYDKIVHAVEADSDAQAERMEHFLEEEDSDQG